MRYWAEANVVASGPIAAGRSGVRRRSVRGGVAMSNAETRQTRFDTSDGRAAKKLRPPRKEMIADGAGEGLQHDRRQSSLHRVPAQSYRPTRSIFSPPASGLLG